jgi:hypothetical protein
MELTSQQERNKVISVLIDNQEIESVLIEGKLDSPAQVAIKKTQNMQDTLVTVPNLL